MPDGTAEFVDVIFEIYFSANAITNDNRKDCKLLHHFSLPTELESKKYAGLVTWLKEYYGISVSVSRYRLCSPRINLHENGPQN